MKHHTSLLPAATLCVALAGFSFSASAQTAGSSPGRAGAATGSATTGVAATINGANSTTNTANNNGAVSTSGTTATTPNASGSAAVTTATPSTSTHNWDSENQYWRNEYSSRPYYNSTTNYSTYQPAYQFGVNSYNQNTGKPYSDLDQAQLRKQWESSRGNSNLTWDQAQPAIRDSYERLYNNRTNTVVP